jgi:pyruvate,water dikinase
VRELAELDAAGDRLGFDLAFGEYLARFGDRCESELKLESPTLHDDPRPLLAAIARLRNAPPDDAHDARTAHDAAALRRDAERRAHDALRGRPLRAFVFTRLTAWARARIVARENLRFERTRVFGRVRRIVVALGEALAARGALGHARDVFHLTIDEVLGYVEGTSASRDLRALAAVRAAESARYAAAPAPPSRFAAHGLPVPPLAALAACDGDDSVRTGTPCCPGIVRARVRVVHDPRETLRAGEILVAQRTDPSWVMLFPAAAAILVERGSQLSHAAIVSREMGIPSVVAIPGLTEWLRDGDLVELDGATGVVQRIEAAS